MDAEEIAIMEEFFAEGYDLLDEIEPKLIQVQQARDLPDEVKNDTFNAIFRVFHSMKGTASILPLPNISTLVHTAESLLSLFRKGQAVFRAGHTAVFLRAIDLLRKLFKQAGVEKHDHGFEEAVDQLCGDIKEVMKSETGANAVSATPAPEMPAAAIPENADPGAAAVPDRPAESAKMDIPITTDMIRRFTSEAEDLLEQVEQNLLGLGKGQAAEEHLHNAFRCLHSFKGNCGYMGLPALEQISHGMESFLEAAQKQHLEVTDDQVSLLLKMVDVLRKTVGDIAGGGQGDLGEHEKYLQKIKALLQSAGKPEAGAPAKSRPPAGASAPASSPAPPVRQDIRVGLGKLDALIDLVGELVIAEAMVTRHPAVMTLKDPGVEQAIHQLRRVSQELQDVALSVRMVPLTATFQKMIRLVHDLSIKSGKQVELKILGGDTEVDKTVSELIADPLVHIVRNAIDHGLEPAAERRALGKPESGSVTIEARHESGEVWILVSDDGRGLNREKLLKKALEKGLLSGDVRQLSDSRVYKLIFEPGFSTAEKVTDISGRGVGLDVVKKNVEKMKGRIDILNKPGKGAIFILRIPLTLAIIEGMLVRVGDTRYTIPLLAIRESFRPQPGQTNVLPDGGEIARVRGKFYPVIRLHKQLGKAKAITCLQEGILVLVQVEGRSACLLVDEILGQQETVIKGLSKYLGEARGISGCSILGDGEVSLLLDVGALINLAASADNGPAEVVAATAG